MIKTSKKLCVFVFVLSLLVLGAVPNASAAEIASGTCGDALVWTLDDSGVLTVSGEGDMYDYSETYLVPWTVQSRTVKKLVISSGVTGIGSNAFNGCDALEEVLLPETLVDIGEYAFKNCNSLKEIVIPASVRMLNGSCFESCYSLSKVTFSDGLEYIGDSVFRYCWSLTEAELPESLTYIGPGAFSGACMETVVIPKNVELIGYGAFSDNPVLKEVYLSAGDLYIDDYAFSNCPELTDLYFNGSYVQWNAIRFGRDLGLENVTVHIEQDTLVMRIYGEDRYETSLDIAQTIKNMDNKQYFDNIVVASGTDFADALSGSYLANHKNAPILLVRNKNIGEIQRYILDNLAPGGTVYILGGENAVSRSMENGLSGINVKRLAGATRYDTNLAILREVGFQHDGTPLIVCTGKNFADGLSASATNMPILLVKDRLTAEQKEYLDTLVPGFEIFIAGGENAVGNRVAQELLNYGYVYRINGANRYETSVVIAALFFPDAYNVVLAYGENFPDGLSGGPLAYQLDAPLLLTAPGKEAYAQTYTDYLWISTGAVLGGPGLIPDRTVRTMFALDDSYVIDVR
ncbi:MAG: cell wall-binding repeat-containing protein [Clostridia bacterium]|nr:cell wall-binding repeat-containing protein [Clostridia bacterium]